MPFVTNQICGAFCVYAICGRSILEALNNAVLFRSPPWLLIRKLFVFSTQNIVFSLSTRDPVVSNYMLVLLTQVPM